MKELIITTLLLLGVFTQAQTFEDETQKITSRIDSITIAEKNLLKSEIRKVDEKLENEEITYQEADAEKKRLADMYASRIELGVNNEKAKLEQLISKRVDAHIAGKVKDTIQEDEDGFTLIHVGYDGKENKEKKRKWSERRTTGQGVFAVGVNTLQSDDSTMGDNLKTWGSRFWEFGYSWNTRLSNESNLLHFKYGLSLLYNNYKPKDDLVFSVNDNKTTLEETNINYDRNRFRNFYLNLPVHFEFDFSPMKYSDEGKKLFRSHKGFRIGLGGYAGVLINSKNFFKYENGDKKVVSEVRDDFNVNNFNYGLSAYVGYKQMSLYSKYDLQPLFENNIIIEDHNFSIGLRWDIN